MSDTHVSTHIANLRHVVPRVRYEAIYWLGKSGDASVVPILTAELKAYTVYYDPVATVYDEEIPPRIIQALGEIGDRAAVSTLIEMLSDGSEKVRLHAVAALGQIGDMTATPALLEALVKGGAWVNRAAVNALGNIGDVSVVPVLLTDWGSSGKVQTLRLNIVIALGQIGHPAAVFALIEAMKSPEPLVCQAATNGVIRIGNAALPALLCMLKDSERAVNGDIMWVLAQIGASVRIDLTEALGDDSPVVRCRAVEILGRIGDASACPALMSALQDRSPQVRWDAAFALEYMGHPAGLPVLVEILLDKDRRPEVFSERRQREAGIGKRRTLQIVSILSKVGVAGAPTFLEALKEPDDTLGAVAVDGLRRLGNSETLPRQILGDRRFSVQEKIDNLDRLRGVHRIDAWYTFPDTVALCQKVVTEPDPEARDGAQAVLGWMTLLRGSQGTSSFPSEELVRPALEASGPVEPEKLLRAADQSQENLESQPVPLTVWQALRRRLPGGSKEGK